MLSCVTENLIFLNFQNVEVDSLGQRSALTYGGNVSFFYSEARRAVGDNVGMSFLVSVVLLYVVEIVSSQNDGVSHLMGDDHSFKDLSSDCDISRERAFLVNVVSFDGLLWGLETETDVLVVSDDFLVLGDQHFLGVGVDSFLLLIAVFSLFNHSSDL